MQLDESNFEVKDKSHFGDPSISLALNSLIHGLTHHSTLNAVSKHVEDEFWRHQTGKWLCEIGPAVMAFGGNVYYKKRFLTLKMWPPGTTEEFKIRIYQLP